MLNLVDTGVVQVVNMQDLLDELLLCLDLRDVGHTGYVADLFHQILPCFLGGGLDPLRQLPVLVGKGGLILRLFLLGQIGLGNALPQ